MNIESIKENVTHFSEEIKQQCKYLDAVVIGGKIKSIMPPVLDNEAFYVLELDDFVGTINVYLSENLYQAYKDKFVEGKFIFLKGFVNVVSRKKGRETCKEYSVVAYDVKEVITL